MKSGMKLSRVVFCSCFTFFGRCHALPFFKSQKRVLPFFKSQNCTLPFFQGEKAGFLPKIVKCYLKSMHLIKFLLSKTADFVLKHHFVFFLMEKHLIKEVNNFWCHNYDCASTAAHSSEKFNTRMFLNIYFKTVPSPSHKNTLFHH